MAFSAGIAFAPKISDGRRERVKLLLGKRDGAYITLASRLFLAH